jgi:polyphenol oxidase
VNVVDLDGFGVTGADKPVADAAISTTPGLVCAVLTADCLPVLFASDDGLIVGAAHAGWRGLAAGVLENTVATMRARMPAAMVLRAWLGPAIGPRHFEVGEEVRAAFVNADAAAVSAFEQHGDRWHADLFALARQRLTRLGIEQVTGGEQCTYTDGEQFFSHRRDVQHRGLPSTGRMAALIWRER